MIASALCRALFLQAATTAAPPYDAPPPAPPPQSEPGPPALAPPRCAAPPAAWLRLHARRVLPPLSVRPRRLDVAQLGSGVVDLDRGGRRRRGDRYRGRSHALIRRLRRGHGHECLRERRSGQRRALRIRRGCRLLLPPG